MVGPHRRALTAVAAFLSLSVSFAAFTSAPVARAEPGPTAAPTVSTGAGSTEVGASVSARARKNARIIVVLRAPAGVATQVAVTGPTRARALKAAGGTSRSVTVRVRPGKYKLQPLSTVVEGREYVPVLKRRSVTAKKNKTVRVVIRWAPAPPPAGLEVQNATRSSIALTWQSATETRYELRVATGDRSPTTRTQGTRVYAGTGRAAEHTALATGARYSYALWVESTKKVNGKTRKVWLGPVTVTTGTLREDPATGADSAEYALANHSTLVDPSDPDDVTIRGNDVWVSLSNRPDPVIGAGVALPASPELPGGYLGTIAEIAADGRSARLNPGGIGDVFDHYEISGSYASGDVDMPETSVGTYDASTDPDPAPAPVPAPATSAATEQPANPGKAAGTSLRPSTPAKTVRPSTSPRGTDAASRQEPRDSCLSFNASALRISVDPTFNVSGDFDVLWHKTTIGSWKFKTEVPHAVTVDVSSSVTVGALIDVELKQELACLLGIDDFYKQVVTYPIPMGIKYSGGLEVRGFGKLNLNDFGFSSTAGFNVHTRIGTAPSYDSDTFYDGETYDPIVEGSIGAEFALTGEVNFGPAAGTKDLGVIAGVGGTLDLAKVSVAGEFGDPATGSARCLDISYGGSADLTLKAEAWAGPLEASRTFVVWDQNWDYPGSPKRFPQGCVKNSELGTGDVQATLRWSNGTDYDLHVIDPAEEHIYYQHQYSTSGGELDYDIIPGCREDSIDGSYVENVNWASGTAPVGTYAVYVDEYNSCDLGGRTWSLEVKVNGRRVLFETGAAGSDVYTFEVPPPT